MKKLIMLLIAVAVIGAIAKLVQEKKAEWSGLTETEVRSKLDAKMKGHMPEDKKAHVQDAIVNKMRSRGVLRDEGVSA